MILADTVCGRYGTDCIICPCYLHGTATKTGNSQKNNLIFYYEISTIIRRCCLN